MREKRKAEESRSECRKTGEQTSSEENEGKQKGEEGDWEKYGQHDPRSGWTRLDFAIPEARDHIFAIIEEVAHVFVVSSKTRCPYESCVYVV